MTLAKDKRKFTSLIPADEPLLNGYDPISINTCIICGRTHIGKRWVHQPSYFAQAVEKALRPNKEATIDSVSVEKTEDGAHVQVEGKIHGKKLVEEYDVEVEQLQGTCSDCGKSDENYFEGVLQLRNCSQEVINKLIQLLKEYESRGMFTNKVTALDKENLDIKLSKQKYIKTLAKDLQKVFGGTIQNDAKLFSYNPMRSKNIYRVNVTYTAFPFTKGMLLSDNYGTIYRVASVHKIATIENVRTKESKKMDAITAKEYKRLIPQKVQITRRGETTYALHPTTFQEVTIQGSVGSKETKVYVVGDELFSLE